MARLAVEGERSIYYEHHRGDNVPIVLVHGYPASGRAWDGQLTGLLQRGHEVVVVDQRCCGRSDKDFDDVSISALADDVVSLVDELSLNRPVLNGWSLGGGVALMAASRLGDRAGGLVLTCGMAPRLTSGDDWPWGMSVDDLGGFVAGIQGGRPAGLRGLAEAAVSSDVGEEAVGWLTRMYLEAGPKIDDSLLDLGKVDQRDELGALQVPVLVIGAEKDGFLAPEAVEKTAEIARDAQLVNIPGVGHSPFLEAAEAYQSALVDFLERVGSATAA